MKIIFSNITNNTFARSAALGLVKAKLLSEYFTTLAVFSGDMWDGLSKLKGLSELQRRSFHPSLKNYVNTNPWKELGRQVASKGGFSSLIRHETGMFNVDAISKQLDKRVAKKLRTTKNKELKGVYSYEDMAMYSFREAKKKNLACLYDLPIGYWRESHRLLEIERQAWPEWEATLTGFSDSDKKLAQKDEELRLADAIFVASSFTANSLKAYPETLAPIHIIPYGFPPVSKVKKDFRSLKEGGPVKLIFVGGLSQRKGIANLFEAVEQLGDKVSLTVVGYKASEDCPALDAALTKHNWIPTLPHDEVLTTMRENHVLVFPSLFEGFGLVMTEAMSQGTPVITTDRTAGPDIITHDKDGWLIDAGSTEALISQISELVENPNKIVAASREAIHSAGNWSWDDYGRKLAETIEQVIKD